MAMASYFENNTIRIRLHNLKHDLHGEMKGNATVTYTVYRANGDVHASGSLTWSGPRRQWDTTITTPNIGDTSTERLAVVVRAVAQGATTDFRGFVTVHGIAAP